MEKYPMRWIRGAAMPEQGLILTCYECKEHFTQTYECRFCGSFFCSACVLYGTCPENKQGLQRHEPKQ